MTAWFPFSVAAIVELLTGLALLVAPATVVDLLLGGGAGQTGIAVARILGIGLISIGVAGWESQEPDAGLAPKIGLCTYNVGAATALLILGANGGIGGVLLWPAVVLHAVLGAVMLWLIVTELSTAGGQRRRHSREV